jgi:dynein heavy chain
MPTVKDFYISGAFRLWLGTRPLDSLPLSLLQSCNRVVLEPGQGLKVNTGKILNSTPKEYLGACPEFMGPFRLLYFVTAFYHSILTERNSYGSLGWNKFYEFNTPDAMMASYSLLGIMKHLKGNQARVPYQMRFIRYVIVDLIFGGKITVEEDRVIADTLAATLF